VRAGPRKLSVAVLAFSIVLSDAATAVAQLVQSDVDAQPGDTGTVQLVTSSTEVRRAVVGLLALAFVLGVLGIVYWYKTGQLARERHARAHRGRHRAQPSAAARPPQRPRTSQPRSSWRRDLLG